MQFLLGSRLFSDQITKSGATAHSFTYDLLHLHTPEFHHRLAIKDAALVPLTALAFARSVSVVAVGISVTRYPYRDQRVQTIAG